MQASPTVCLQRPRSGHVSVFQKWISYMETCFINAFPPTYLFQKWISSSSRDLRESESAVLMSEAAGGVDAAAAVADGEERRIFTAQEALAVIGEASALRMATEASALTGDMGAALADLQARAPALAPWAG